jgi:hypothetical protein
MEYIAMKCTREQYESIKENIGELTCQCPTDFVFFDYLVNGPDGAYMDTRGSNLGANVKVYDAFNADIFLKACDIEPDKKAFEDTQSQKFAEELAKSYEHFLKRGMLLNFDLGGAEITPDQLKNLTDRPKRGSILQGRTQGPKLLKMGSVYTWHDKEFGVKILFKVVKDDGKELFGYGFLGKSFNKKQKTWYTGRHYDEAKANFTEVTAEKWESALLKYKKPKK